jgi:hypothetical protein
VPAMGSVFHLTNLTLNFTCAYKTLMPVWKTRGVSVLPLALLNRVLADVDLQKTVSDIQEKILIFESLRDAMRIARVEVHQGLNDVGDENIKTCIQLISAIHFFQD